MLANAAAIIVCQYVARYIMGVDWHMRLIRFRGHLPKGGYDVQTDGRHFQTPAPAPAVR
jgi:hypothetical protein